MPSDEKICSTLEANGVIIFFAQRWQSQKNLLNNTLDSGVKGIYYGNYLFDLEE